MRIKRVDLADADTIRACFEVFLAAQQADEPDGPFFTERPFRGWLTAGWGGDPREVWLAEGTAEGTVAGWYRLELPDLENLDQAELTLVVHPAQRRRGIGRALLKHAATRAAEHGRSVLNAPTRLGGDGEAFARARGRGARAGGRAAGDGHPRDGRRSAGPAARDRRREGLGVLAGVLDRAGARGVHRAGGGALRRAQRRSARPGDRARGLGRTAGPRARQRPAPALRAADLRGGGATRRHRGAGRPDRGRGGSGRSGLGAPDADRRDPGAPRAPARPAGQGGHGGVAQDGGAAAGTDRRPGTPSPTST